MNKVTLISEIIDNDNSALKTRSGLIENVEGIGPPDMCIVLREHLPGGLKRLISKPYQKQYYHFVYGVDSSSIASVAGYFKHFLDSYNKISSSSKVISACFCAFDLFSKYDLRVEMRIPGNMNAYLVDQAGNKFIPQDIHWQGVYLSSVIRLCYPIQGSGMGYIESFKTVEDYEKLFEISSLFWGQLGFVLGDLTDTKKYKHNLLFPAINKFLLKRKRYKLHQMLIRKLVGKDPLMLTFLAKSSMKMGKLEEIIQLLGNQIKITPHAFPLYYTIAKAYLCRGDTVQALHIAQYLIELNLEVFEYWELLINCYLKKKDIMAALLAFNQLPHYSIEPESYKIPQPNPDLMQAEKVSFATSSKIWSTPKDLDYKPFEEYYYTKTKREKTLITQLDALPGSQLQGSAQRAYKILAKIEKSIEWSNLVKINKDTFRSLTTSEKTLKLQNFSSINETNKSGFTRNFQGTSLEYAAKHEQEVDEEIFPVQMLTCRDYFLQDSKTNNKLNSLMNRGARVQNEATAELLNAMNQDLKAIYEWQKESSDIKAVHSQQNSKLYADEIPFTGDLWIRRAKLSERLLRNKQAERAYRYVVEKGFSVFAWFRLMKIYAKAGNPKAVLVCMAEFAKQMENENIVFDSMPLWVEEILGKLCKGCGFKQVFSIGLEVGVKKTPALFNCIEKLRYWRTDGVNDS